MTFVWFVIWLIANNVGGSEPLGLDPVGFWAAALVLSVAIDLNRPRHELAQRRAWARPWRGRDESLAHHDVDRLREIAAPHGAEVGGPMR